MDDIRNYIRERYGKAIKGGSGCCGSGGCCCGAPGSQDILSMTENNYDAQILRKAPGMAGSQSFGCGDPVSEAGIRSGETILDLGSGAGLDLFLASEAAGPSGKVFGLDMTDEMLETAAENLKGLDNVVLLKGEMEDIPLEDASVDVIISNCVINLSPDKGRVLKEAFRVLRTGGRFCVSDTVFLRPVSERIGRNLAAWSGCISGALQAESYAEKMREAGFQQVEVRPVKVYSFPSAMAATFFPELPPEEREEMNGALASAIITAKKIASGG